MARMRTEPRLTNRQTIQSKENSPVCFLLYQPLQTQRKQLIALNVTEGDARHLQGISFPPAHMS